MLPLLLMACEEQPAPSVPEPPWSNEAEVLFQEAEALRHEVIRQQQALRRMRAEGLEGAPPEPR